MQKKFLWLGILIVGLITTGAGCIQLGGGNAAAGPMGMFQTIDKGETWKQIAAMPTLQGVQSIAGVNVYRMHTDPSDPNALYIASRGQGLYYTLDFGASWASVAAMSGKYIYGMAVDPHNKCVVYVTDGPHIYKTKDCLRTFEIIYTEERPDQRIIGLAVDYGNSNTVYAAQMAGDILGSSDAGKSWRVTKRFGFQLQYLEADKFTPGRIWVAAYQNGLFRSDNGTDWNDLSPGLDAYNEARRFNRLILNPAKKDSVFWVSKYGILKSDDAGNNWTDLKLITPPGSVNIYGFVVSPKNPNEMYYTGTILGDKNVHVRSTFYKTTDGGKNWVTKKLPTNSIPVWMLIHPDRDGVIDMSFATL